MSQSDFEKALAEAGIDASQVKPIGDVIATTKRWDLTHKEVMDVPLVIVSYVPIVTSVGDAYLARCVVDNQVLEILIGSGILMKQLDEAKDHLPISATITKVKHYYCFR